MRVELSNRAREDIEARTRYLLENNPTVASAFVRALDEVFALLVQHPLAGRLVFLKSRRAPVRRWLLPPLAIYYEPRGDVLFVIRVRHSARRPLTK